MAGISSLTDQTLAAAADDPCVLENKKIAKVKHHVCREEASVLVQRHEGRDNSIQLGVLQYTIHQSRGRHLQEGVRNIL